MGYIKAEQGQETVFETEPEKVPSQFWRVFAVFSPVLLLSLLIGWWLELAFLFVIWVVAWMIRNSKNSQAYRSAAKFSVRPEGITLNGQFLKTPDIHRVLIRNHLMGDQEIIVIANGGNMAAGARAGGLAIRNQIATISYRVDVEAGGVAHTLAGGLSETVAYAIQSDVARIIGFS